MIYAFINPALLSERPGGAAPLPTPLLREAEWIPVTGWGEEELLHLSGLLQQRRRRRRRDSPAGPRGPG